MTAYERINLDTQRAQTIQRKVRLRTDLESRSLCFGHPRWQAGERAIGLEHDDERDTATFETPPHHHGFAEAGVEPVCDANFDWVFAGSMSCVRAAAAPLGGSRFSDRSAWPCAPHGMRGVLERVEPYAADPL